MKALSAIQSVPVDAIGELPPEQYVGLIDEAAVECLVARFAVEGLLSPIWVRRNGNAANKPWSVIAGRHRLLAARRLGWTEIKIDPRADMTSGMDMLHRLQVAENLDRRVLRPIERALNLMCRWHSLAQSRSWDIVSRARDVDIETAALCGVDDRTVRRYRRLHETIVVPYPDLFPRLNAHALGESFSAMTRIAQITTVQGQRAVIETIVSDPTLVTIDAAMAAAQVSSSKGTRATPAAAAYNGFLGAFSRMAAPEQKVAATMFAAAVRPEVAKEMIAAFMKRGISL